MPKCTVIIIQAGDVESNHIRITDIPFDPNSTSYQFKLEIHTLLKTPKYKTNLLNDVSYYSDIGIINESLSPHDIFQIFDQDLLMDCISPNDTLYIYNPSINTDTVLIGEIINFYSHLNNQQYNDNDNDNDYDYDYNTNDNKQSEINNNEDSQSYRKMSISQSYQSQSGDIDIKSTTNNTNTNNNNDKKQTFFNAINLYFAYCGAKYGQDGGAKHSSQLVQISHSILIWALRKMDNLWKRQDVQDKLREYLNTYCFEEEVVIDTIIFGNKLSDDNAMHLITYSPWMVSEPTFSIETYQLLQQQHSSGNSLSSEQAYAPIINEQHALLNSNNNNSEENISVDHPYFHTNESKENKNNNNENNINIETDSPIPHKEKYRDDSLDNTFTEIKRNKDMIENGPRRWPACEGLFLYCCQFVFGLCDDEKFYKYMCKFGDIIGLSKETIKYILLLWESEKDLSKSLWHFAELKFPIVK